MATGKIEFHLAEPDIGPLELEYVTRAVKSGWISSIGEFIGRFEKGIADLCEVKYGVAVSNGTAALHLALVSLGIGPGDEVIVPALTFVATAAAVIHAGATPVFIDSEPETYNMDPQAVRAAITGRTRAVIVVHLYGHPVDMDPILELIQKRDCVIIEDAAEAHGASYRTQKVGSIGRVGTFSFYGNKILTTGEGGAVVTNDESLANRMRFLKDHAMDSQRRYWHPEVGYNYRMTNIQAAMGCAQIERFNSIIEKRQRLIDAYRERLSDLPVRINPSEDWANPAPWLTTMLLPHGVRANGLANELRNAGIDSRPFFVPLDIMPPYKKCRSVTGEGDSGCPVAYDLHERGIILPTVPTARNELLVPLLVDITDKYISNRLTSK